MSSSDLPSFLSVEMSLVGTVINGVILHGMLWGLYTVVYLGTLYVYSTKKASQHWIVIGTISLSYLSYVAWSIVLWYTVQHSFVKDSDSRDSLYLALEPGNSWTTLLGNVVSFVMAALADGLLIWRCFNIWDRSYRVIALQSLLLVGQIGVALACIVLTSVNLLKISLAQAVMLNKLLGAEAFLTFATTLIATFLISYRLHTTPMENMPSSSRKLFKKILEILVQSAAMYSVAALANATPLVVVQTWENGSAIYAAGTYTSEFFLFISGVAPTVMVARVAFLDDTHRDASTLSMRVSNLQFHVQSAAPRNTTFSRSGSIIEDRNSEMPPASDGLNEKGDEETSI